MNMFEIYFADFISTKNQCAFAFFAWQNCFCHASQHFCYVCDVFMWHVTLSSPNRSWDA